MASPPSDVSQPHPHDLPDGTPVGRYRIQGIVGRGGMGTVYSAFDDETKRDVAVKVLHPGQPEALRERFLAECEAEAKIRNAHVMPVYDRGTFGDDRLYFVMELVYEPITLTDVVEVKNQGLLGQKWPRLRHWSSTQRLVQDVFLPIAEGVDAANREYGFLHRDLKPDNVLIDVRTRRPYLIDFGICHSLDQPLESGKIYGTPRFLSPEQSRGRVDARTDVWGLGALLYYVLSGQPPIEASSPLRRAERADRVAALEREAEAARKAGDEDRVAELKARHSALANPKLRTVEDMLRDAREGVYPPLPDNAPAAARAVVAKAMAVDPDERYATAAEMVADLRSWVQGGRVQALSEQDATGAAVAAAQRTLQRHVKTALWVVLGLAIGLPVGARLLGPEDEERKVRLADTAEDVERLASSVDALAREPAATRLSAERWEQVRDEIEAVAAQAKRLPPGPQQDDALATLKALRTRTDPPLLVIDDSAQRSWRMSRPPITPIEETWQLDPDGTPLEPGPYWIAGTRVRVPLYVPMQVGPAGAQGATEVRIALSDVPRGIPSGMVYVSAGRSAPGEPEVGPFLIGISEVTCVEYAEWLDELDAGERPSRVPTEGFQADSQMPGRYLVQPAYEDRAVTGIRPDAATAFAEWRASVDGVAIRLPTDAEWRRAAGRDLLSPPYVAFFRPLRVEPNGKVKPDRSPHGVEGLRTVPAEIVSTADGYAVKGETEGLGIRRLAEALDHSRPAAPDEAVVAAFRLVQPLR